MARCTSAMVASSRWNCHACAALASEAPRGATSKAALMLNIAIAERKLRETMAFPPRFNRNASAAALGLGEQLPQMINGPRRSAGNALDRLEHICAADRAHIDLELRGFLQIFRIPMGGEKRRLQRLSPVRRHPRRRHERPRHRI